MMNLVKEYGIRIKLIKDYGSLECKLWQAMTRASINGKWGPWVAVPLGDCTTKAAALGTIARNRVAMGDIEPGPDCTLAIGKEVARLPTTTIDYNPHGLM